ncbi:MAG TPA: hypothetical protein VD846_02125 [Allosphingosinicella sp.]|nr:hypothetical protein [Allosphingosinicella sp.]
MSLALLLALQPAPPAPGPRLLPVDFDLAEVKPADPCRTGAAGASDIVVCGRRPGGVFDFTKWEREFRTRPLLAEKGIGPGTVIRAYGESVGMPGGQISKRAMVGLRLKF